MDITYVPMARGFVYLAAVMDWASRRVLAWRVSISMSTDFCIEALQDAVARYGTPEIFNTDQGSQFTSLDFTEVLKAHHIEISMDGKGCWRDNVFVERLWKTIKYEEVYLWAYPSVAEARASIGRYIDGFYNARRPHSSLDRRTPMRPTSLRCSPSRLQHNHGRNPLSRSQPAVQPNRARSSFIFYARVPQSAQSRGLTGASKNTVVKLLD